MKKIKLPVAIFLSAVVLGMSHYAVQDNKQHSIEKQQRIKIGQETKEFRIKMLLETEKQEAKRKEYIAKRKMECYEIGQKERDNWNNVDGQYYDEEYDVCKVRYENKNWREGGPIFSMINEETGEWEEGKYFMKEF